MTGQNKFAKEIRIGTKVIREGGPVFIIAEAGINHNGDMVLAKKLVDMAKAGGADAVKFQTFVAEEEVTKKLQKVAYQKEGEADQEPYFDMIKRWEFNETQWRELSDYAKKKGIIFISTPSEEVSARLLHRLKVPAFKIASNDMVTIPMIEEIAEWHTPMIISTGMAVPEEIEETLSVVRAAGATDVVILHCTSEYPTPAHDLNLRAITTLQKTFDCLVGFSDHSAGVTAAPLAVLLGAVVVETHITLDKTLPGPDQRLALDQGEFTGLVKAIRHAEAVPENARAAEMRKIPNAEVMLGSAEKKPTPAELEMRVPTRKSIVARRDIKVGEVLERSMLAYRRSSGTGLPPRDYKTVLGKKTVVDIPQDEFITREALR